MMWCHWGSWGAEHQRMSITHEPQLQGSTNLEQGHEHSLGQAHLAHHKLVLGLENYHESFHTLTKHIKQTTTTCLPCTAEAVVNDRAAVLPHLLPLALLLPRNVCKHLILLLPRPLHQEIVRVQQLPLGLALLQALLPGLALVHAPAWCL